MYSLSQDSSKDINGIKSCIQDYFWWQSLEKINMLDEIGTDSTEESYMAREYFQESRVRVQWWYGVLST